MSWLKQKTTEQIKSVHLPFGWWMQWASYRSFTIWVMNAIGIIPPVTIHLLQGRNYEYWYVQYVAYSSKVHRVANLKVAVWSLSFENAPRTFLKKRILWFWGWGEPIFACHPPQKALGSTMTSLGSTRKHYEALRKHYESTWNLSRLKNHALKTYVQKTEFESTMCQFQPVEVIAVT
jgi:hypothetical protein